MKPFGELAVSKVFSAYPKDVRERLLAVRDLIFATAKRIPEVGELEETLKWGQPSYLTSESKSGSTIRIDAIRAKPGSYAVYFHCQTTLVESFRQRFGPKFRYQANRALIFSGTEKLPTAELRECIAEALTYHVSKVPRSIHATAQRNTLNSRAVSALAPPHKLKPAGDAVRRLQR